MNAQEERTALETSTINVEDVMSVYSGKNGSCCCGCAGKHTYASATRTLASKDRGYAVSDDEVSDRTVKMIVRKMNKWPGKMEFDLGHVAVVVNERLYVAYLIPKEGR